MKLNPKHILYETASLTAFVLGFAFFIGLIVVTLTSTPLGNDESVSSDLTMAFYIILLWGASSTITYTLRGIDLTKITWHEYVYADYIAITLIMLPFGLMWLMMGYIAISFSLAIKRYFKK